MDRRLLACDARNSRACSQDARGGGRPPFPAMLARRVAAGVAAMLARWPWRAWLLLVALGGASHAGAADSPRTATEAGVKAAYLYKFATYVEWPPATFARADAALTIGIIGADDVAAELVKIKAAAAASGRSMEVKVLRAGEAATGVHILFVGRHDTARLARLLGAASALPALTVTESSGGLDSGSIINFVIVDDRIRFEVSLPHAERNGIKVSVRLLNVALRVEARRP